MLIDRLKIILYLLKGGRKSMQALIDVYVALIVAKRRNIDQVPEHMRPAVLADLNALGLDGYGDPIQA